MQASDLIRVMIERLKNVECASSQMEHDNHISPVVKDSSVYLCRNNTSIIHFFMFSFSNVYSRG